MTTHDPTGSPADRPADRDADRPADRDADRPADRDADRPAERDALAAGTTHTLGGTADVAAVAEAMTAVRLVVVPAGGDAPAARETVVEVADHRAPRGLVEYHRRDRDRDELWVRDLGGGAAPRPPALAVRAPLHRWRAHQTIDDGCLLTALRLTDAGAATVELACWGPAYDPEEGPPGAVGVAGADPDRVVLRRRLEDLPPRPGGGR